MFLALGTMEPLATVTSGTGGGNRDRLAIAAVGTEINVAVNLIATVRTIFHGGYSF